MPVANKPHFQLIGGTFKLLFIGPGAGVAGNDMAMADECCCDWDGSRPGYAIYARDCCTGVVNPNLYLDLTRPPSHAFTKVFNDPVDGACIRFDPTDVATAILMSDPGFTGSRDFLATGFYSWDRYNSCNECYCGIDPSGESNCCYDYINYPDATIRGGTSLYYWSYSGISVLADVMACHKCLTYTESDGSPTYQKITKLTIPTGPYTSYYSSGWHDNSCDPLRPDAEMITTFYHDSSCNELSDNRLPQHNNMVITPEQIFITWPSYFASPYTSNNIFDSTAAFATPSADAWVPCDGTVTFPDSGYAGTRPTAGGGSVTIYPCCPSEPGGV